MGGRGGGSPGKRGGNEAGAALSGAQMVANAYRDTVRDNGFADNAWVSLADIRPRLEVMGLTDRSAQDRAIKDFSVQPGSDLSPIANLKSLSQADRDAAIWAGNERKHAISIGN